MGLAHPGFEHPVPLLVPLAIDRAISERLQARVRLGDLEEAPQYDVDALLDEAVESVKDEAFSEFIGEYVKQCQRGGTDPTTAVATATRAFRDRWADRDARLALAPGKEVLAALNRLLRDRFGISISSNSVITHMQPDEVPGDLVAFLRKLRDHFATSTPGVQVHASSGS